MTDIFKNFVNLYKTGEKKCGHRVHCLSIIPFPLRVQGVISQLWTCTSKYLTLPITKKHRRDIEYIGMFKQVHHFKISSTKESNICFSSFKY